MSREERKMAQIIASIERMEQRKAATPSSASSSRATDSNAESDGNVSSSNIAAPKSDNNRPKMERMNSSEIHAQVQKSTRLGAKGKKLKPLSTSHGGGGVKVRSGSKKGKTPQEVVVNKREIVECKLTPKKRWIQLWNEQLLTSDESTDGDKKEVQQEPEKEPSQETIEKDELVNKPVAIKVKKIPETPLKPTRPTITHGEDDPVKEEGEEDDDDEEGAVKVTDAEQVLAPASPQADEQKEASISPVSSVKETSKDVAASLATQEKKEERSRTAATKPIPALDSRRVSKKTKATKNAEAPVSSSDSDDTKKSTARKTASTNTSAGADDSLRVKTPQVPESSHLSPPLEQHSPAAAASISPSAKKDAEATNSAETTSPSEESARATSPDRSLHEAKASPGSPIPRKDMAELLSKPREGSRKRSLERKESEPLTEEEKRRAERRRKRKSNWDVGDPRFASRNGEKQSVRSPSSDGNSPSRKFPLGRSSWRHSNSMDATYSSKSSFQNSNSSSNRSSFSGGSTGPVRRGFYSSTSLPLDRSRSAGRSSSSRYNYSSNNNNINSYR